MQVQQRFQEASVEGVGGGVIQHQLQHLLELLSIPGHYKDLACLQLMEELGLHSIGKFVDH